MLKGTKHGANLQLFKCAADLCLPLPRSNSRIMSVFKNQSTPIFLIIKSAVDFIKRVRAGSGSDKMQKVNPKSGGSQSGEISETILQPKGTRQTAAKPFNKPNSK